MTSIVLAKGKFGSLVQGQGRVGWGQSWGGVGLSGEQSRPRRELCQD